MLSVTDWLPIVAVPAFTVLVAVTVLTLMSLPNATLIVVSSPLCVIVVLILVPSPDTVTLEPNLFVFSPPLSASNFKPLLISSVFVSSSSVLDAISLIVTVFLFAGFLASCTVKSTLLPDTV